MSNTHYVRVYVNESIQNVTTGFYNEGYTRPEYKSPDVLRVFLADPQTGRVKAERFLRNNDRDENGLYYDGIRLTKVQQPHGNNILILCLIASAWLLMLQLAKIVM